MTSGETQQMLTVTLLLALLIVAVAAGCFIFGRTLRGGLRSDHLGGIGSIRNLGVYVALRTDCKDVGRATDHDSWLGRPRLLLATCEMIIEHRFDLRAMRIRQRPGGVDLVLPEATVMISHGDVRVEYMQSGTVFGLPIRRLRACHINHLLAKARENMSASQARPNDFLAESARESVRSFLLDLAAKLAPELTVHIVFEEGGVAVGTRPSASHADRPAPDSVALAPFVPPFEREVGIAAVA